MSTCDWAILCDYAFLDLNRKLCLIGVFDHVVAAAVPTVQHQAALALRLVGEPGERVQLRLELIRPTGERLASLESGGDLGPTGTAELHLAMAGLPLPDYGIYAFNLYIGNTLAKTVALTVTRPPQDGGQA